MKSVQPSSTRHVNRNEPGREAAPVRRMPALSACAPWRSGARLDISAWRDPKARAGGPGFQAGRRPGEWFADLGPGQPLRAGVRLPLPAEGAVILWHEGFLCGRPGQPPSVRLAAVAPGTWAIDTPADRGPQLFSTEQDVQSLSPGRWQIELPGLCLALASAPDRAGRHAIALAPNAAEAWQQAQDALNADLNAWMEEGFRRREALEHLPPLDGTPAALHAFESLASALRAPEGALDDRWMADTDGSFPMRNMPLWCEAWLGIDPPVAAALLRTAAGQVDARGQLAARLRPSGPAPDAPPAWPVLAQTALRVVERAGDALAPAELLPALLRLTEHTLASSDPMRRGLPCWPSAEASLIPELHDEALGSCALAGLLRREFLALQALGARAGLPSDGLRAQAAEAERLLDRLEHTYFAASAGGFQDRYVGGDFVRRRHLGGLLASGTPGLPFALRDRHLREWENNPSLNSRDGARAWEYWADDPHPAPVPLALQVPALIAFESDEDTQRRTALRDTLRAHLTTRFRSGSSPDDDLAGPGRSPETGAAWPAAPAALLLVVALGTGAATASRPLSPSMRWVERRRHLIGLAAAGLAVLLVLLAGVRGLFITDTSGTREKAELGMGRHHYTRGDYDAAEERAAACLDGHPTSETASEAWLLRGNIHFQRKNWTEAEAAYRHAGVLDAAKPAPVWNLAQALQRQGRLDDALAALREVERRFGPRDAALQRRVDDARAVIRTQKELPEVRNRL